jgi:hypothetical protein
MTVQSAPKGPMGKPSGCATSPAAERRAREAPPPRASHTRSSARRATGARPEQGAPDLAFGATPAAVLASLPPPAAVGMPTHHDVLALLASGPATLPRLRECWPDAHAVGVASVVHGLVAKGLAAVDPTCDRAARMAYRATAAGVDALGVTASADGDDRGALAPDVQALDVRDELESVPVLSRRVHDTEVAATRAERRAVEHPHQGREAKVARARKEAVSGTRLTKTLDGSAVTRIAQCSRCGRVAELRGDPTRLWELGWGSWRNTAIPTWPRVWFCGECWPMEAPKPAVGPRSCVVDPGRLGRLLEISRMRAHAKPRLRLVALIKRLLTVDPDCGEAMVRTIVYAAESKTAARQWRALMPAWLTREDRS